MHPLYTSYDRRNHYGKRKSRLLPGLCEHQQSCQGETISFGLSPLAPLCDGVIEELWRSGYIVNTKVGTIAGGTYKCNFDVEITMDILRVVYQVKPDIIVLASGDSDFVSL